MTYTFDVTYTPGADGSPAQAVDVDDAQCDANPVLVLDDNGTPGVPGDDFNAGDTDADGFLDGGETWSYTCDYAVAASHANGEEDPILNTADVSGDDLDDEAVTGDTSDEVRSTSPTPRARSRSSRAPTSPRSPTAAP